MKYKICSLLTILGALFILSCNKKYYYFYSNKEDFIQQVKCHQDTERVYTQYDIDGILYNLLNLLLTRSSNGDAVYWRYLYCNYKKYYYFYDMKTKMLDTIKGEPDDISTIIIFKKDGTSRKFPLDKLKIISDSLLGSVYYYNNKLIIRKKRAIKLNEIDSIVYRVSEFDYINKEYKYKPISNNCIERR